MTRVPFQQAATQLIVVSSSGLFLALYIGAKLSVWPWGAYSF